MSEAQKVGDRKIHGVQLSNRINEDDIRSIERVKNIIEDLEHHGPAGLIHIAILSKIIGKPIKIWNADNSLNSTIGKERIGSAINIEYHANNLGGIGHWTLLQDKDPDTQFDLNSCLFSVISSQTGLKASELRRWTVLKIKANLRQLAEWLDEILKLKETNNEVILMIGGARYCGMFVSNAKSVLDKSQDAPFESNYYTESRGHPRIHVSDESAVGETSSVQNYTKARREPKSAFSTPECQNQLAHLVLTSKQAINAFIRLNHDSYSETLRLKPEDLNIFGRYFPSVYEGQQFNEWGVGGPKKRIRELVMILKHHKGYFLIKNHDVLVLTFYPYLEYTEYIRTYRT